jgi:thiol-disulfide isomerase/thioredoxin
MQQKLILIFLFLISFTGFCQQKTTPEVVDFEGVSPLLSATDDKIYIINFWATWCAPCIKEIPYFEQILEKYQDQKVEVILVSLDFAEHLENRVIPFIEKNNIQSQVVVLDDTNSNYWIPLVHPQWSGAIPATLIYHKNHRKFYEKSFTYNELENELKTFLP